MVFVPAIFRFTSQCLFLLKFLIVWFMLPSKYSLFHRQTYLGAPSGMIVSLGSLGVSLRCVPIALSTLSFPLMILCSPAFPNLVLIYFSCWCIFGLGCLCVVRCPRG